MSPTRPAQAGFIIGDHPAARSVMGLRKPQVVGALSCLALGFVALIARPDVAGIAGLCLLAALGGELFLLGIKGVTLDRILTSAASFATERLSQSHGRNNYNSFGCRIDHRPEFIAAGNSGGIRRIRERVRRRPSIRGNSRVSHAGWISESGEDGCPIGVGRCGPGRICVAGFELFGGNFIYSDNDHQTMAADGFARALESIGGLVSGFESVTVLFCTEPGKDEDHLIPGSVNAQICRIEAEIERNRIVRSAFLLIYFQGEFSRSQVDRVSETLVAGGMEAVPLSAASLRRLFCFGFGGAASKESLHMRPGWDHLLVDQRIMQVMDAVAMPAGPVRPDFLVPFVNSLTSTSIIGFRLRVLNPTFALRKVRARRSGVTADAGIRALFGFIARNSEAEAIRSLENKEQDLDLGFQMFSVSARVAVVADSRIDMLRSAQEVKAGAEKAGLMFECAYGRQLAARRSLFGVGG